MSTTANVTISKIIIKKPHVHLYNIIFKIIFDIHYCVSRVQDPNLTFKIRSCYLTLCEYGNFIKINITNLHLVPYGSYF